MSCLWWKNSIEVSLWTRTEKSFPQGLEWRLRRTLMQCATSRRCRPCSRSVLSRRYTPLARSRKCAILSHQCGMRIPGGLKRFEIRRSFGKAERCFAVGTYHPFTVLGIKWSIRKGDTYAKRKSLFFSWVKQPKGILFKI